MTLQQILHNGVTIYGPTSIQLDHGSYRKIDRESTFELPIECEYEGRELTVALDEDEQEIMIVDESHGETKANRRLRKADSC